MRFGDINNINMNIYINFVVSIVVVIVFSRVIMLGLVTFGLHSRSFCLFRSPILVFVLGSRGFIARLLCCLLRSLGCARPDPVLNPLIPRTAYSSVS